MTQLDWSTIAKDWQTVSTVVRMAFRTGDITATMAFKEVYARRTGKGFSTDDNDVKAAPMAVEPIYNNRTEKGITALVVMPNHHLYQIAIHTGPSNRSCVKLIWFEDTDATRRSIVEWRNMSIRNSVARSESTEVVEVERDVEPPIKKAAS